MTPILRENEGEVAPLPSPNKIIDAVMGYRSAKVLLVAVSYDLFTLVERGIRTAEDVASHLGVNPRAVSILMDALVSQGYLKKEHGAYFNSDISSRFLVEERKNYLGNNLKYQEVIWDAWSDLKDVVRAGSPSRSLEEWIRKEKRFTREYIRGMNNIALKPAGEIADLFNGNSFRAILDVGGGPGAYSRSLLRKNPDLQADIIDLPETIEVARDLLSGDPDGKRLHFLPGNYHHLDFGRDMYDFVLMSHITHDEGEAENLHLIEKAFRALKPGGILLIHDFMTNAERTHPEFAALFSVHMLVYTQKGRVYSVADYESWLKKSGFRLKGRHEICKESLNASMALAATRPRQ